MTIIATPKITAETRSLIDQIAEADAIVKDMTKNTIAPGKELLADIFIETGEKKIAGSRGGSVSFSESDVYNPIPISKLKMFLEEQGKGDKLFQCLTVSMKDLKEFVTPDEIKKLQGPLVGKKVSLRLTWSPKK